MGAAESKADVAASPRAFTRPSQTDGSLEVIATRRNESLSPIDLDLDKKHVTQYRTSSKRACWGSWIVNRPPFSSFRMLPPLVQLSTISVSSCSSYDGGSTHLTFSLSESLDESLTDTSHEFYDESPTLSDSEHESLIFHQDDYSVTSTRKSNAQEGYNEDFNEDARALGVLRKRANEILEAARSSQVDGIKQADSEHVAPEADSHCGAWFVNGISGDLAEQCMEVCALEGFTSYIESREETRLEHQPTKDVLCRREQLVSEAVALEGQGDLVGAQSRLEECLRLDQAMNSDVIKSAEVYYKLGVVQWKIGSYHQSLRVLLISLQFYEMAIGCTSLESTWISGIIPFKIDALAAVLNSLGRVYLSMDIEGSQAYRAALARTMNCIGMVHDVRGRYSRAMRNYKEGLRIQRLCLGNENVDVAASLNSIGVIHEKCGHYDKAMDCYTEALSIYRSQLGYGCSPVDVAVTLNNVGFIYHLWGEYNNAMAAYVDALDILRLILGPNHRNVASTLYNIAQTYLEQGSHETAIQILQDVLESQRTTLGDCHADVAMTLDSIGKGHECLNRLSKAVTFYEKTLQIRRRSLGGMHIHVAVAFDRLGQVYLKVGALDQAKSCYQSALQVYKLNGLGKDDCRICVVEEILSNL